MAQVCGGSNFDFVAQRKHDAALRVAGAAEQWLLGDPEQPPMAHELNVIEHVLFTHRLVGRSPGLKEPVTFL